MPGFLRGKRQVQCSAWTPSHHVQGTVQCGSERPGGDLFPGCVGGGQRLPERMLQGAQQRLRLRL
jgi:hypothetical protein